MNKIKFVAVFMALLMVVCGCGNSAKSPKDVTESFLKAVQSFDDQTIYDLTTGGNFVDKGNNTSDESGIDLFRSITAKMTYSVGDATEDGDSAKVKVHIESIDMSPIMQQIFLNALSNAFSQTSSMSDSEQLSMIKEQIDKADTTVQKDVEVQLKKVDGEWKIDGSGNANDDLYNAVTGGLLDFANSFGSEK